tara:strand:- start:1942 stop:2316 length:375 start_codon:yes stop_codon:yes gene_type:complete
MTFRITTRGASASRDNEAHRAGVDSTDTNRASWRLVMSPDGKHFMEMWIEKLTPSGRTRTDYVTMRMADEDIADIQNAIEGFQIHHHALGNYEIPATHLYAGEEITGSHQGCTDLEVIVNSNLF